MHFTQTIQDIIRVGFITNERTLLNNVMLYISHVKVQDIFRTQEIVGMPLGHFITTLMIDFRKFQGGCGMHVPKFLAKETTNCVAR